MCRLHPCLLYVRIYAKIYKKKFFILGDASLHRLLKKEAVPHNFPWTPARTTSKREREVRGRERAKKFLKMDEGVAAWKNVGATVEVEAEQESESKCVYVFFMCKF
jgi:hypothetical protein